MCNNPRDFLKTDMTYDMPSERCKMPLYSDLLFTEALDLIDRLITATDPDVIGQISEEVAKDKDLAHVVIALLVVKAKGADLSTKTGVELANTKPTFADLIIPPHLERFRRT